MLLGLVKGHVVSSAKVASLHGKKLLMVEVVSVREHGLVTTGRDMVCVDAVQAGKGEVVLSVKAAAVNFPDLLIVQGKYQFKPEGEFSPGSEVAGIVKAVGEGVRGINIGDHAIGSVPYGGFAEECAVPFKRVIPIPKAMPFPVCIMAILSSLASR